jgi:glutathione S-transferase
MITLTAFSWVPSFAQGLVRDLRVRWALEEAGWPYKERLVDLQSKNSPEYRRLQPFGQVPAFEEDGLALFESGSIVLHIAERSPSLMPADQSTRAHVKTWMFAALNSIEQHVQNLTEIDLFNADKAWAKERRPAVEQRAKTRLGELSTALGEREYLVGDGFTAADLLMTSVLRIPRQTSLVADVANLEAYRLRCESRPAFKRALEAQMRQFERNAPAAQSA